MDKLSINDTVRAQLVVYEAHLPSSMLISGKKGIGLCTIAQQLASAYDSQLISPEYITKQSSTKQIGISVIRELYDSTKSKSKVLKVVIIDDAELMTVAAQNSFLKLLEEPNDATTFILTSHVPDRLLPTVRSRLTHLHIPLISPDQTNELLNASSALDTRRRAQIAFVASGLPAEITRLLHDKEHYQVTVERVAHARSLLAATRYDRLVAAAKTSAGRAEILLVIEMMIELINRSVSADSIERVKALLLAYEKISNGGNIKVQLARSVI